MKRKPGKKNWRSKVAYLNQDKNDPVDAQKRIEAEYLKRFEDGYMRGKKEATEDVKDRCVSIVHVKEKRKVTDPYSMGYEVGYLRQLLWVLTQGRIT